MAAQSLENPSQVRVAPASPMTISNERTDERTHVTPNDDCAILEVSDVRARVQTLDDQHKGICSEPNCAGRVHGNDLCASHYAKRRRETRMCRVEGCGRPLNTKGLCSGHYYRLRTTGSVGTEPLIERRGKMEERFWRHVNKTDSSWLWTGNISRTGYGRLNRAYAHRLSYEINVGPIPEGLQLDHLCRVRACCNPAHLEPVTQLENMRRSPFFGMYRGPGVRLGDCERPTPADPAACELPGRETSETTETGSAA